MSDEDNQPQNDGDINQEEKKEEEPKGPFNPLKPDLLKKSLSKLSKTYSKNPLNYRWIILCLCQIQFTRERNR